MKDWTSYFVSKICVYVHNRNGTHPEKSISSLRDLMTPEEIARYDEYWVNVAENISDKAIDRQIAYIKQGVLQNQEEESSILQKLVQQLI